MTVLQQLTAVTIVILLADSIWLSATNDSARQMIAALQGVPLRIRIAPAFLVYIIMIGAVWFFAVAPSATVMEAAGRGAVLGFSMYGLYDMTNYATLVKYPFWFAITDMAWGTFLFATAAAAGAWR
jgi:uncharacterized membrane protein